MSSQKQNKQQTNNKKQGKKQQQNKQQKSKSQDLVVATSSAPVAVSQTIVTKNPQMSHRKNGAFVFRHSEFIRTISGNTTPSIATFPLNPAQSSTFPWLCNIAYLFEQYRFTFLRFRYIPRCATSTAGAVILGSDYDARDAPPLNEIELTQLARVVEDAPWKNISFTVDLSKTKVMYIRPGGAPSDTDIKTYDIGSFYAGMFDAAANAGWGKLWVDYEVEFYHPNPNQAPNSGEMIGAPTSQGTFLFNGTFNGGMTMAGDGTGSATGYRPVGSLSIFPSADSIGSKTAFNTNYLAISGCVPGSKYRLVLTVRGTGTTYLTSAANIYGGSFTSTPMSYNNFGLMAMNNSTNCGGVMEFVCDGTQNHLVILWNTSAYTTITGTFVGVYQIPAGSNY